jgi:hypothetical protein
MKIRDKDALCNKLVYEVRYQHGMTYLDRCGTIANRIMMTYPEWVLQDSPNPQNAPMIHPLTGMQFNFNPLKYDSSLDQSVDKALGRDDIETFIDQVEGLSTVVHEELELKTFIREGFRIWYILDMESEHQANQWITNLGVFRVSPVVPTAFEGEIEAAGHFVIVTTNERKYRISINPAERLERLDVGNLTVLPRSLSKRQRQVLIEKMKAKRQLRLNPQHAVAIDVDAYVEEPIEVVPRDFMTRSVEVIETALPKAFRRE